MAQIKSRVIPTKTGAGRESGHDLIMSLPQEQASPRRLMALMRKHWRIENSLFHVKDDSFGENRHVLQSHHCGAVMSLLRSAAINLLRGEGSLWQDHDPLTSWAEAVYLASVPLLLPAPL